MESIDIRELGEPDRLALWGMYRDFEPLGVAQGVPPVDRQARRDWMDSLLGAGLNLGAATPDGRILGHTILAESDAGEAELAFFVHQDHRQQRLGTRLVEATVAHAREIGYRRVWATVLADNVPALRLLKGSGFKPCSRLLPAMEFELSLPEPQPVTSPQRS